jgi:hypothetical protein
MVVVALVLGGPALAQAHSQEYNDGYTMGQSYAKQGLNIDTGFFNSHSKLARCWLMSVFLMTRVKNGSTTSKTAKINGEPN